MVISKTGKLITSRVLANLEIFLFSAFVCLAFLTDHLLIRLVHRQGVDQDHDACPMERAHLLAPAHVRISQLLVPLEDGLQLAGPRVENGLHRHLCCQLPGLKLRTNG